LLTIDGERHNVFESSVLTSGRLLTPIYRGKFIPRWRYTSTKNRCRDKGWLIFLFFYW